MTIKIRTLLLIGTHAAAIGLGFGLGIYALPILTAPESPSVELVRSAATAATYQGEFRRDLADSDALHWGEGTLSVGQDTISFEGLSAVSLANVRRDGGRFRGAENPDGGSRPGTNLREFHGYRTGRY